MPIIFVTTDNAKWGAGKGGPLTAAEADNDIWELLERIVALETSPPTPDELAAVLQNGNVIEFRLQSGTVLGTAVLPRATPSAPVRDPVVSAATFTPAIGDSGRLVRLTDAGGCLVTIPPVASVAWLVSTEIHFLAEAGGNVVLQPGAGVTFVSVPGFEFAAAQQGSVLTAKMLANDLWLISGWLKASA